jgi:NAD(P)-dependent dehydrogenase (short-subunit alcohol dehydrogenase family)
MKYAIVTGGARGLGLGIVRAMLDENTAAHIAVIDRDLAPPPHEIAEYVSGYKADVTDEKSVGAAVAEITKKLGASPAILCNNAGGGAADWFTPGREAAWVSPDLWRKYVELNLNSVYVVSREVAPKMTAGGAICNTSSIAGMLPSPVLAAYAAAKAGVISYTRTLAMQLAPQGIRVNAVAPGLIYTQVWQDLGAALGGGQANARATFDNAVRGMVPLGREQTPEDIGRAVSFLCSDRAASITGQVIVVDGGIVLSSAAQALNRQT